MFQLGSDAGGWGASAFNGGPIYGGGVEGYRGNQGGVLFVAFQCICARALLALQVVGGGTCALTLLLWVGVGRGGCKLRGRRQEGGGVTPGRSEGGCAKANEAHETSHKANGSR